MLIAIGYVILICSSLSYILDSFNPINLIFIGIFGILYAPKYEDIKQFCAVYISGSVCIVLSTYTYIGVL